MKILIQLIALLFISSWVKSQPGIVWMRDAGAFSNERGNSVTTDPAGNVYIAGALVTTSEFDTIQVNAYFDDFLAKYNSAGDIQWVQTMGGSGSSDIIITRIKCDQNGNVYVVGRFGFQPLFQTVTFDTITVNGSAPYQEFGFVAKYNTNGNIQWLRYGGGNPSHAILYDLDFDSNGNIYACGDFSDYATFNGQTVTAALTVSNAGMWVKYDANGNLLHLAQTSSNSRSELYGIEIAPNTGNIYLAGTFKDSISINGVSVLPVGNSQNTFLLSLDSSVNVNWVRNGGGNNFQYNTSVGGIEIDHMENIYLTGSAVGTLVQFGGLSYTGTSLYDGEIMTIKYNSSGNEQWLRHGGGVTSGDALDIITDSNGNSIITGFLNGNVLYATFGNDSIQMMSQSRHCFLVKYDTNGNNLYVKRMGTGNDEFGRGLAFFNDTTFYLTGATQGLTQFDTLVFIASFPDPNVFLAKFYDSTSGVSTGIVEDVKSIKDPSIYPNPATSLVRMKFSLDNPSDITINISDITGRKINQFYIGQMTKGSHVINMDLSGVPPGVYVCTVESNIASQTIKLIIN